MKKVYPAIALSLFLCSFSSTTLASTYDDQFISDLQSFIPNSKYSPELDTNISEKELGINKVTILPDNFFYFINEIKNGTVSIFSINKTEQINTILKTSSQKLKELEKCTLLKTSNEECIKKGVNNYEKSKKEIYTKIDALNSKEKENLIEQLFQLEFNQFILLNNINNKNNQEWVKQQIDLNLNNFSKFAKTINDNISFKKHIESIVSKNDGMKLLIVNNFLNSFKNYLNLEKRNIIDAIINSNNILLIKNINNIQIKDLEKTLQYYFYKINDDTVHQIKTLDELYQLANQSENSPNKENIKIAILNTKQVAISIFNQKFDKLTAIEIDKNLEEIFSGDVIQKINIIELISKYNNGKKDIKSYQLEAIEDSNLDILYKKISEISDSIQKERYLNSIISEISPENNNLILRIIEKIESESSNDINSKIVIDRIKNNLTESKILNPEELLTCQLIYDPVCGINGITYNNECFAKKSNIKIAYNTECRILENDKLNSVQQKELDKGWYLGDKTQKKPGTPLSWINIDSDTKNAKWIDPKKYTNLKGITNQ